MNTNTIKNASITVIYLKEDDHVIAVIQNNNNWKTIRCYTFKDQHNVGDPLYFKSLEPATKEEYRSLHNHLSNGPYDNCRITIGTKKDIY